MEKRRNIFGFGYCQKKKEKSGEGGPRKATLTQFILVAYGGKEGKKKCGQGKGLDIVHIWAKSHWGGLLRTSKERVLLFWGNKRILRWAAKDR